MLAFREIVCIRRIVSDANAGQRRLVARTRSGAQCPSDASKLRAAARAGNRFDLIQGRKYYGITIAFICDNQKVRRWGEESGENR
jgi:hypothetical protein